MKKRIIAAVCICALVIAGVAVAPNITQVEAKTKTFDVNLKGGVKTIKLTWKKQKKAKKYKIYRVKANKYVKNDKVPSFKKYKKIKTVKNKKSYTDKKVKKGNYYAYVVKAYKKNGKLVATSYVKGTMVYEYAGLMKPTLTNAGYGEEYSNTPNKIYLRAAADFGANPSKYMFYRKAAGDSKYKKISPKILSKGKSSNPYVEVLDSTVKPGVKYTYKVKTYKKYKKKKYYSKYSKTITIPAVNSEANYAVESLTKAGEGVSEVVFKVTNKDKYNGAFTFYSNVCEQCNYYMQETATSKEYSYDCQFTQYSTDNITWNVIPKDGITYTGMNPIYIKAKLSISKEDKDTKVIIFGGKDCYKSYIGADDDGGEGNVKYEGSGSGFTCANFDFVKGTGTAYQEWD